MRNKSFRKSTSPVLPLNAQQMTFQPAKPKIVKILKDFKIKERLNLTTKYIKSSWDRCQKPLSTSSKVVWNKQIVLHQPNYLVNVRCSTKLVGSTYTIMHTSLEKEIEPTNSNVKSDSNQRQTYYRMCTL